MYLDRSSIPTARGFLPTWREYVTQRPLVILEGLLAAGILAVVLLARPRTEWVRWAVLTGITLVLAYPFAKIGSALYSDPRPFAVDHVRPLITHARIPASPPDHALLAAALVVMVSFVRPALAVPVALLGILVDWARVGAGLHHVADVAGSTLFVALAAIALIVAPAIMHVPLRHLPE